MSERAVKNSIFGLALATLFVPFVVGTSNAFFVDLFFPFITGKAFAFRVLVGLMFALWLVLIIKNKSYLPTKNFLFIS